MTARADDRKKGDAVSDFVCHFCSEPLRYGDPMCQWVGENYDTVTKSFKGRVLAHEECILAQREGRPS